MSGQSEKVVPVWYIRKIMSGESEKALTFGILEKCITFSLFLPSGTCPGPA